MWVVIVGGTAGFLWAVFYEKNNIGSLTDTQKNAIKGYCKTFAIVPTLFSLLFLLDAFRRMHSNHTLSTQISHGKILVHSLIFLALFLTDVLIVVTIS
jgi:protein-S-isoprenylcysteine O-methyltransferase Ste14